MSNDQSITRDPFFAALVSAAAVIVTCAIAITIAITIDRFNGDTGQQPVQLVEVQPSAGGPPRRIAADRVVQLSPSQAPSGEPATYVHMSDGNIIIVLGDIDTIADLLAGV